MSRRVYSLLLMVVSFFVFAASAQADPLIVKKVHEAQEYLKDVEIPFDVQEKIRVAKRKRYKEEHVVGKQIALLAWDRHEDKFHVIYLSTPHPLLSSGFQFNVETDGFAVQHVAGKTVSKLVFRAWKKVGIATLPLVVLAGKHWWLPPGRSSETRKNEFMKIAVEAIYTPFADDLYFEEITGEKFLYSEIKKALDDLCAKEVMSRALPGTILCRAIPWELLFNLALNEQMDHGKFKNDGWRTAKEVANEYALNLSGAFRWSVSSANARGAYQFTNRSRRGNTGTYDLVVGAYEDAELMEDFEEGAQDLQNMIKAAACLLDTELSKFPKEVHDLFEKDYKLGSVFPVAAYNEGFGGAKQLYQWIKKNKFEIALDKEIPQAAFVRYKRNTRKTVNTETQVYIQKHLFLWSFVDEFKKRLAEEQLQ